MTVTQNATSEHDTRLHKPGVAGSSPAAASSEPHSLPQNTPVFHAACAATISHCPAEEYHSWPQTSCSQLKELASSPLGFYWRYVAKTAPPKASDALSYGTLLHLWAEIGEQAFWDRVQVAPSDVVTATGQLGKAAEPWRKGLPPNAIPLSPVTNDQLWQQTRQILFNEAALELLQTTVDREFNVVWNWHGHDMRCRCDGATALCWYDLKTTKEANPRKSFWRAVDDWGYDIQCAVYMAAATAAGWPPNKLRFICTSNVWPHHCAVVELPDGVIERGRKRALSLLAELQQRREWGSWVPADYHRVHELECPQFMYERNY